MHDLSGKAEQPLRNHDHDAVRRRHRRRIAALLTLELLLAAVAIVFLVRPIPGIAVLLGFDRGWNERLAISFSGPRGIGTFCYLAFAPNQAPFTDPEGVRVLAGTTILLSAIVLRIAATPVVEEFPGEEGPELEETIRDESPSAG